MLSVGWASAKLSIKASSAVSRVEVLPPSFGSVSRAVQKGTASVSVRPNIHGIDARAQHHCMSDLSPDGSATQQRGHQLCSRVK